MVNEIESAEEPNGNEQGSADSRSFLSRLLKPPKNVDPNPEGETFEVIPPEGRKEAMRVLEPGEIKIGYLASGIALLFSLLLTVPFMFGPTQTTQTAKKVNGVCPATYELIKGVCTHYVIRQPSYYIFPLVVYLIFTLAIFVTVRMKRRVPASFSAMLTGVAFTSTSIAIGAPLLIFGGWLFIRARRIQKFGTAEQKAVTVLAQEQRLERKNNPQASRRDRPTKSARSAKSTTPSGPAVSKRYTPPKPKRKKPPVQPS